MLGYIKCPKCQEFNPLYTPYPQCYQCGYVDYLIVNKIEKESENKVKEMVKHLIPTGTPSIDFPESSINPATNEENGGWSCKSEIGDTLTNNISIPRKLFTYQEK